VGHGRSNSFDRMIALEPFRRSASGRNKLPTYLPMYSDADAVLRHLSTLMSIIHGEGRVGE